MCEFPSLFVNCLAVSATLIESSQRIISETESTSATQRDMLKFGVSHEIVIIYLLLYSFVLAVDIPSEYQKTQFFGESPCFPRMRVVKSETCLRVGTRYGKFYLPPQWRKFLPNDGLYYGFGCGEDISFDVGLASLFRNATLRLFDPTPRAIDHVNAVFQTIEKGTIPRPPSSGRKGYYLHDDGEEHEVSGNDNAVQFFKDVKALSLDKRRFTHKPYALATEDTTMYFSPPAVKTHVSHYFGKNGTGGLAVLGRTLSSIMSEFGDKRIDVLKCDVEGAEVEIIPYFVELFEKWDKANWPKWILFDMDSLREGHPRYNPVGAKAATAKLRKIGYEHYASDGADVCWKLL